MAHIASPRRLPPVTPTSSGRPSLEATTRSLTGSPSPSGAAAAAPPSSSSSADPKSRAGRAALREYYHLRRVNTTGSAASAGSSPAAAPPPLLEVTDPLGVGVGRGSGSGSGSGGTPPPPASSSSSTSSAATAAATAAAAGDVPLGELDAEGFDADAYVKRTLAGCGLEDVLRAYARVLAEMRALDAEKEALVYDNYSKLIAATETIRRMRASMDPLSPAASALDPAIGQIYTQAASLRDALRENVPPPRVSVGADRAARERRIRTRQLARLAATAPGRVRALAAEGRLEEARAEWEMPRRLLERWRELGLGGDGVGALIEEGDQAVAAAEDEDVVLARASADR